MHITFLNWKCGILQIEHVGLCKIYGMGQMAVVKITLQYMPLTSSSIYRPSINKFISK